MASEKLNQAVQFIKSGNKIAALPILKEVVQAEPNNDNAWLWLYSCVEKVEQKKYCLQQALRIDPNNQEARNALLKLENHMPVKIQSTYTQVDAPKLSSVGRQDSESSPTQDKTRGSTTRKSVLPFIIIFVISACLVLPLLVILIVRPSTSSQIFNLCNGPQKLDTTLRGRMENQKRGPAWQGNAGILMWRSKRE